MSFLKRIYGPLLVVATCMLLASCGQSSDSSGSSTAVQTIKWQPDGTGSTQLLTNDTQFYDTVFIDTYAQTSESRMTTVTATVRKMLGYSASGYGIVFCHQDDDNFYRLLIDTSGQYSVYSKVAGDFNVIIPWTSTFTAPLHSGYGVVNEISVTQQSLNNFSVSFNGVQETQFHDTHFSGGKAGFYAYVAQDGENFPSNPEDVRFRLSSPVAIP